MARRTKTPRGTTVHDTITTHFPFVTATQGTGATAVIDLGFAWHPADPHTVRMLVCPRGQATPVVWHLDRLTLAAGLDGPVGIGDFSLLPDLRGPDGLGIELVLAVQGTGVPSNLSLPLPARGLRAFLDDTFAARPAEAEHAGWDTAELAGGAAA